MEDGFLTRYLFKLIFGVGLGGLFTSFAFWSIWGDHGDKPAAPSAGLHVGFGEADITPSFGKKPIYMAGFGHNRKATAIHDPLMARAVVLRDGRIVADTRDFSQALQALQSSAETAPVPEGEPAE